MLHFIVYVLGPIYPSAADMSWGLSVDINIKDTPFLYVGMYDLPYNVCVSVCISLSINVMKNVWKLSENIRFLK